MNNTQIDRNKAIAVSAVGEVAKQNDWWLKVRDTGFWREFGTDKVRLYETGEPKNIAVMEEEIRAAMKNEAIERLTDHVRENRDLHHSVVMGFLEDVDEARTGCILCWLEIPDLHQETKIASAKYMSA